MSRLGLLIDYGFCTGCKSCEMACKVEHNFPKGINGIVLSGIGPWQIGEKPNGEKKWQYSWVPIPTDLCDLCEARVSEGKLPTCVHHCQASVMKFGPVEELTKEMGQKPRTVLFVPR